ncbi:Lsr2 family protein [Rhodococcus aetherivorans]|uniref:histone-like nucleoid-structuring protein Lsr2 n=1 Tax=Rhodococcus aetherivorans TaxID=191292 RepID=UPI003890C39E
MAKKQKTVYEYTDDLTNEPFGDGEGETVRFGLNDSTYELELNNENIDKLNDLLAPYIEAARKVGGAKRGRPAGTSTSTRKSAGAGRSKEESMAIREWANANGHKVGPKGRIAQPIIEAYEAAHQSKAS